MKSQKDKKAAAEEKTEMPKKIKEAALGEEPCPGCWRIRFKETLMESRKLISPPPELDKFLGEEFRKREQAYKEIRVKGKRVYDEMREIRLLAGDVFLKRYRSKKKKE